MSVEKGNQEGIDLFDFTKTVYKLLIRILLFYKKISSKNSCNNDYYCYYISCFRLSGGI